VAREPAAWLIAMPGVGAIQLVTGPVEDLRQALM
jgi:hypothetical protein